MKYRPAHIAEYTLILLFGGLARILPLRAALALGWFFAAITYFIGRMHVERTRERIRSVLKDTATEKEVHRIAWIAWRNLFFNAVEGIRFPRLTPRKIRRQPLAALEPELKRILEQQPGGFVLATPHMGNWEIAGIAADLLGIPLLTIVRKQKNPLMNRYMNNLRRSFDVEVLHRERKIWKTVVDRIRQGKVLAILPDISVRARGVTVNYLNGQATIATGAARFALLAQCPIYPIVVRRIGWTKHDAVLLDPIIPDPQADRDNEEQRVMQEIMTAFSREVLKTPEQYFWHNKRWVLNTK